MMILEKNEISQYLYKYYKEKYGEKDSDKWFEQPAANERVLARKGMTKLC